MKDNNLSKSKILEIANLFLANVVSMYELERISGVPAPVILKAFNEDLCKINHEKAEKVKKILNIPGYLKCTGYIKEQARYQV